MERTARSSNEYLHRRTSINDLMRRKEDSEANVVDLDSTACVEAPVPELKNESTWVGVTVASLWVLYVMVSQPVNDGSIYKGRIFVSTEEIMYAIKTFSTKLHQQYYVSKSTKLLLKLQCKWLNECP